LTHAVHEDRGDAARAPLGSEEAIEIMAGVFVFLIVFLPIFARIVRIITADNERRNHPK
jgi:hypothetical protein